MGFYYSYLEYSQKHKQSKYTGEDLYRLIFCNGSP